MVLQVFLTQTMGKFPKPRSHPRLMSLIRRLRNERWVGIVPLRVALLGRAAYKRKARSGRGNILGFPTYGFGMGGIVEMH